MPLDDPPQKAFAAYLAAKKILIADPSATARSGLFRVFQELGAKPNQIILVNTFKQAAQQIEEAKPHIVIAEYELGRRCGLDLLQTQREQRPQETKSMIFVVITGNTSQTAVARAAEEDIDAYLLKPFTPETVRATLMKAALLKTSPPRYIQAIETGKVLMEKGDFDGAEKLFLDAMQLDPTPSLACYYLGQLKFLRKFMSEARGRYQNGLEFNNIHYKCLVGLYELLMAQKYHDQAYEVVKRISQYFPANPKRLSEVLKLAIMNSKYEDVERYYAIFCNIDERDETLIRYVCAALVVCGKYYLNINLKIRATELFNKAAASGSGRTKVLKEIVQALLDHGMTKEAKTFLVKFPAESQASDDYLLMRFQILNAEGNRSLIIDAGRELLAKGMKDERLYAIMITRSAEAHLSAAAETLAREAALAFPTKKDAFEALIKRAL